MIIIILKLIHTGRKKSKEVNFKYCYIPLSLLPLFKYCYIPLSLSLNILMELHAPNLTLLTALIHIKWKASS